MHHKHIYMCTNIQTCVNNILLSISLSFPSFVRTLAEIVVVLFLFLADRPFLPLGGLFSVFNVKCVERERERAAAKRRQWKGQTIQKRKAKRTACAEYEYSPIVGRCLCKMLRDRLRKWQATHKHTHTNTNRYTYTYIGRQTVMGHNQSNAMQLIMPLDFVHCAYHCSRFI